MNTNDLLRKHSELAYAVEVLINSAKYHDDTAALAFWDARREVQFYEAPPAPPDSSRETVLTRIYDLESTLRAIKVVAESHPDDPDFTLSTIADTARIALKLRPLAVKHSEPVLSTQGNGICDDPSVPLDQW